MLDNRLPKRKVSQTTAANLYPQTVRTKKERRQNERNSNKQRQHKQHVSHRNHFACQPGLFGACRLCLKSTCGRSDLDGI